MGKTLLSGGMVVSGAETKRADVLIDGDVIEAAGTQQGVIKSKVTASKWTYWGELKAVDYTKEDEPVADGYAKVTGKRVALRQEPSTRATVILRVNTGETVKIEPEPEKIWEYVEYKGKKGWMMREFLQE